jgi:hypothetical protein
MDIALVCTMNKHGVQRNEGKGGWGNERHGEKVEAWEKEGINRKI